MVKKLTLVVLFCLGIYINSTSVRRDPVTGKWVEYSGQLSELGIHDSRAGKGGDDGGGDFFGGFDFIDSRIPNQEQNQQQNQQQENELNTIENLPSTISETVGLRTTEFGSKKSKFIAEIPIDQSNLVQLDQQQQQNSQETYSAPTQIERISHPFVEQANIQTAQGPAILKPIPLGNVCRFGGYAPISGCPVEATNGCVDIIPCQRKCDNGAYFSWKCLGPVTLTPQQAKLLPTPEVAEPAKPPIQPNAQVITDLAQKLETAIKNNDYKTLAAAILQAQSSRSKSLAATQLIETALQAQAQMVQRDQNNAEEFNSDNTVNNNSDNIIDNNNNVSNNNLDNVIDNSENMVNDNAINNNSDVVLVNNSDVV